MTGVFRTCLLPAVCLAALAAATAPASAASQETLAPEAAPAPLPAAASAPGESPAPGEPDPAFGGSLLLRLLDAASAAPGTDSPDPAADASRTPDCPRDVLARLLAGAADREDALSALAIEQEILKLCLERRRIVAEMFEAEARLRDLRAAPGEDSPAAPEPDAASPPSTAAAEPSAPSAPPGGESESEAPPRPRWGWFSIVGTQDDLRAGITDGREVWFVREGGTLPGGARVGRIVVRPPGVLLEGGDGGALPYRAVSGGVR